MESALDATIKKLERDVVDLELIPDFEDGVVGVYREANALAVVALALGTSSEESAAKAATPAILAAAQKAARAQTLEEAQAAFAEIVAARSSVGSPDSLRWEKVASLRPLMKNALPALTTEIKRLGRNEKTFLREANTKKVLDNAAILVAIALGCRENVDETLAPNEDELWREYCERLYSASIEFNDQANAVAAGEGSFDAMFAAFKKVEATCNSTCHEKFGGQAAE